MAAPAKTVTFKEGQSAELTMGQAADLLNVSRRYLINLLETGEISYHKVGVHRRVSLKSLLEYKRRVDRLRDKALRALVRQGQDLEM